MRDRRRREDADDARDPYAGWKSPSPDGDVGQAHLPSDAARCSSNPRLVEKLDLSHPVQRNACPPVAARENGVFSTLHAMTHLLLYAKYNRCAAQMGPGKLWRSDGCDSLLSCAFDFTLPTPKDVGNMDGLPEYDLARLRLRTEDVADVMQAVGWQRLLDGRIHDSLPSTIDAASRVPAADPLPPNVY